jgi:hypothetical protein
MKRSKAYQELLAERGICLSDLGIRDIALTRIDALKAVGILQMESIPILGGDVFFRRGSNISVAYANWYCQPKSGEGPEAFSVRSWEKAANYINNFPEHGEKEAVFVIVVKT